MSYFHHNVSNPIPKWSKLCSRSAAVATVAQQGKDTFGSKTQRVRCHFTGPGGDIDIFIAFLIHYVASKGRPCGNAPMKFIWADFSPDYHKTPADTHDHPHLTSWEHFWLLLTTSNVSNISNLASLSLGSEIRVQGIMKKKVNLLENNFKLPLARSYLSFVLY